MTITDDYTFGTVSTTLDNMTDEEAREYFEDLEADYWINEYKNGF